MLSVYTILIDFKYGYWLLYSYAYFFISIGLMHCELSHLELKLIDAARKVPEDAGIKSKSCHV